MVLEQKISSDGECPLTVSDNLKIDVSSYKIEFDDVILRHGSISGFNAKNLVASYHTFIMNVSENDINWEIYEKDGSKRKLTMKPNHIIFNPANNPVSRYTEDYYEFIIIYIEPDKMISSAKTVENDITYKELYNIDDPHLQHIMQLLLSEVRMENQNGKLFIENLISLLSMHFIKNYTVSNSDLVNNIEGLTQGEYEKTLNYIEDNMSDVIKLEDLAESIGLDKFNLIRKFKSSVNITPYKFILQRKLERSKILLQEFKYTLTDITYMLNFSNQSHFSNSFKNAYGLTPNEFRKTF